MTAYLPAATAVGNATLNIGIFVGFVLVTLAIVIKVAAGKKTAEQYYTAAGAFSGRQNGIAIAGDYLSAASFLGIAGAIALRGLDGFLYSIGFLVAWLVALLLVAELMRNIGRFTMADVLSYRLQQRPVRIATSVSVLCVSLFYLLAQMAGAGGLVSLLLGVSGELAQNLVIAVVGGVMVAYVLIGGMKGTTWVQIIKAILLITATAIMTVWVLAKFGFSISNLFGGAIETTGKSHRWVLPAHPGHRLRRRRLGRPGQDQWRAGQAELGRSAARLRARWQPAARHRLRYRVRDHPRGRCRSDDHRVGDLRA